MRTARTLLWRLAGVAAVVALASGIVPVASQSLRPARPDDVFELRTVRDPRISPDGAWVAYAVSRADRATDSVDTDIYMAPLAPTRGDPVRLTSSPSPETAPRWSPDGRFVAFLSRREGSHQQVWLVDRRGGDPSQLTTYAANVSDLAWSPDSTKLALVVKDRDATDSEHPTPGVALPRASPRPIVIDRLQFKRDGDGFLDHRRTHVHVFDVAAGTSTQVTDGDFDDLHPTWSPSGREIAFTSNRTADADSNDDSDIFVVSAAGGPVTRLTQSPRAESHPQFSPDGGRVAYLLGGDPRDIWYDTTDIGIVSTGADDARVLTAALDRFVSPPVFSADGATLLFTVERGGNVHLASMPAGGGPLSTIVGGERDVSAVDVHARAPLVVLASEPHRPAEIFAWRNASLAPVTATNDRWLAGLALGRVDRVRVPGVEGGPDIDAFITRPAVESATGTAPAIVRLHGGPVTQHSTAFQLEWQVLAGAGFTVVAPNPRGSSGHGRDFSHAIWASWGDADAKDVLAVVDEVVKRGWAPADRLGVGGWSYGGILTNYLIVQSNRFKAAITGASEVNYLANYGVDQYQRQWEAELGLPWRTPETWMRLSPFFNVERIATPTLIMSGEDDVNVPSLNSEQLYQALKRLGRVDTQLVMYPGQSHAIVRPTFQVDRLERYLAWYGTYLHPRRASLTGPTPRASRTRYRQ